MNTEPIYTPSSKLYNGVMVKTMICKRGDYETEYIDDREYDAYCHWCKTYQNGHIDFNTAMNIIKGDNLQRFYQPVDFERVEKVNAIKKSTAQKVDDVIAKYNEIKRSV